MTTLSSHKQKVLAEVDRLISPLLTGRHLQQNRIAILSMVRGLIDQTAKLTFNEVKPKKERVKEGDDMDEYWARGVNTAIEQMISNYEEFTK